MLVWIEVSSGGVLCFSFQNVLRHVRMGCGRVMLLGPQPGLTRCLQWDFSDLEAGRLAARQQIRSPESAASQGPCALWGSQQGSLTTRSLRPTLTVVTKAPRGSPLLGPADIQRQNSTWVLWDPHKGRRESGRRISLESAWYAQLWKTHSLPWKVKI